MYKKIVPAEMVVINNTFISLRVGFNLHWDVVSSYWKLANRFDQSHALLKSVIIRIEK